MANASRTRDAVGNSYKRRYLKAYREMDQRERDAVMEYCGTAHPSNVPYDIEGATWSIWVYPDGAMTAGVL